MEGRRSICLLCVARFYQLRLKAHSGSLRHRLGTDNSGESEMDLSVSSFLLSRLSLIDLIQWAHAPSPIRVKTISGLLECKSSHHFLRTPLTSRQTGSDESQSIEPIPIKSVSVGHRHIAIVLDNAVEQPGGIYFGRDVFVWGLVRPPPHSPYLFDRY